MELHQIRYFLALCDEGNFTRAAKRCGVSQPSLSNAIKRLEREFGAQLFYRNRMGCSLSELGQELRPHLTHLDRCATEARERAARFLAAPGASAADLQQASSSHRPEHPPKRTEPRMTLAAAIRLVPAGGAVMRLHYAIAIAAVILVAFGARLFVNTPKAEADSLAIRSASLKPSHVRQREPLAVERFNDLSLVFPGGD